MKKNEEKVKWLTAFLCRLIKKVISEKEMTERGKE